jgi:thiosulfate/3-mercaptopyruvate sulfurtransferase
MAEILVSIDRLQSLAGSGTSLLVDCRFNLSNPEKSFQDYLEGHIPGALYAHLDKHLSSAITPQSGRHPLPDAGQFADFLASIAWQPGKLLVAYDEGSNAFSGRLWWLMRYFGLNAALLDGGLAAWKKAALPLEPGQPVISPGNKPELSVTPGLTVNATDILESKGQLTLVDARVPERYSGAVEPLDSKAGHIPGALNRPLGLNLDADGYFKSPAQLRDEFSKLLSGRQISDVVHYCGSGVTACHNAFSMELAGLGSTRIYPGSWSEWVRDPSRPIETGN